MKLSLTVLVLLPVFEVCLASKIRYDGYKVFRITPHSENHLNLLHELKRLGASFWEGPNSIGKASDVMIPPHLQGDLLKSVHDSGATMLEFIPDVQKLADQETVNTRKGVRLEWTQYYRLDAIYEFLAEQAAKHPNISSVVSIGKSFEGKDINLIKISKSGETKPAIWLDSNIHAREWISGAVLTYVINQILNSEDPEVQSWTEDFDFYLLPIANPDGFEYTHTNDRLWRKTRSTTDSIFGCKGADPNRNFGYMWLTGGSSTQPCDETFAGPAEFSEPETLAISNFFNTIASRAVCFVSIHSYSQYILLPYGVEGEDLPQKDEYMRIAGKSAASIAQKYGTQFIWGSITDLLYPASGGSMDWVKGIHNTNLTLSFELRDTGENGFLLPPSEIIPSSEEFMDGLQVFIDELRTGVPLKETKTIVKPALGIKSPVSRFFYDAQTFGDVPSNNRGPIIPT